MKDSNIHIDILLISPDQGSPFPWGILALGSYLTGVKKRNVCLINAYALSEVEFQQELDQLLPNLKLVGIGFLSSDSKFVKDLVDYIKNKRPEVKIIVGGPHAVLLPEQTAHYKHIDFVAYTFGEQTLDVLIQELSHSKPNLDNVPGLLYKNNGKVLKTAPSELVGFYEIDYNLLPEVTRKTFNEYIQVLAGR